MGAAKSTTRITLADVAKKTGFSRTAVSYALRDHPNVPASTREEIKEAARKLGYRPDPLLSKLMLHLHERRGKRSYSGKLAFINPHDDEDFAHRVTALKDFFQSAAVRARELGFEYEEFWLHEPKRSPKRLADMLHARGIRGILLGSTARDGSKVIFPWEKFAAVTVGYSVQSPQIHRVVTHHYRNTRLALRKIEALGWSRIGFASHTTREAAMEHGHLAAFLVHQQMSAVQQRVPPLLVDEPTPANVGAWYREHRPEVILSTARSFHGALTQAGVSVPGDAGFVHLAIGSEIRGIAGIHFGYERLGPAAINVLVAQLQRDEYGPPVDPRIILVEGQWRDGPTLRARGG